MSKVEMNRIKYLRVSQGIRQLDLAKQMNIGQSTLSQWEAGRHEPDYKSLTFLADLFNVSTDYILGKTDIPTPPEEKIDLPEGLTYAHFQGLKELDNDDRRELIRMMERMIELDKLRKEQQATKS